MSLSSIWIKCTQETIQWSAHHSITSQSTQMATRNDKIQSLRNSIWIRFCCDVNSRNIQRWLTQTISHQISNRMKKNVQKFSLI